MPDKELHGSNFLINVTFICIYRLFKKVKNTKIIKMREISL